ncbi:MAG: hypothetical protein KA413_00255 [Candidatus Methylopumilus sp.]|nr:hypothetical protein [Candidatus Methylopumilus sp.]
MDIEKIRIKARYFKSLYKKQFRNSTKFTQDADDFEQFCLESMLRRQSEDLNYKWISIDFLRSPQSITYDDKRSGLSLEFHENNIFREDILKLLPTLELHKMDRSILILLMKWGLTSREIAEVFSCDEGYISQRIRSLKETLKTKIDITSFQA